MKRELVVLTVVVVTVSAMIIAAVHWTRTNYPTQVVLPTNGVVIKDKPAPDFALKSLDGRTVKLSELRGKAVVLNFWATWCEPCKIEMPWFVELNNKYKAQGLELVGINVDDSVDSKKKVQDEVAKFAQELGVNYTVLAGTTDVADAYGGVQYLPTTVYIDRSGIIYEHVYGLKGYNEIEDNIKHILGGSAAPAGTVQTQEKQDKGAAGGKK
jgi:cytochrome c biogenesis protein CcmG/thiol:disulfide interchange protein DsbE